MPRLTQQIVHGFSVQSIKGFPRRFFSCSVLLLYMVPWGYNKQNSRMPHEQFRCEAEGLLQPHNKWERPLFQIGATLSSPDTPRTPLNNVTQTKQTNANLLWRVYEGVHLSSVSSSPNPQRKITGAQIQIRMAIAHPTLPSISLEGPWYALEFSEVAFVPFGLKQSEDTTFVSACCHCCHRWSPY